MLSPPERRVPVLGPTSEIFIVAGHSDLSQRFVEWDWDRV